MPNREQRRAAKDDENTVITITVDAVEYVFDPMNVTSAIERELWVAAGLTQTGILGAFARREFAPFMIAGLVFLARRSRGDRVTYEAIEESITIGSEIDINMDGDDATESEAPEVPAAD